MLGFRTTTCCPSCGQRITRRTYARHVCAHAVLPEPPRLDVIAPGVAQSEGGTLYLSPSLLMSAALRTGAVDTEALAGLLGEIVRAVEMPVVQ